MPRLPKEALALGGRRQLADVAVVEALVISVEHVGVQVGDLRAGGTDCEGCSGSPMDEIKKASYQVTADPDRMNVYKTKL